MYLSKKEMTHLGDILKILYKKNDSDSIKIYQETTKKGLMSENVLGAESERNAEKLEKFNTFQDFVTKRSRINEHEYEYVRLKIMDMIRNKNKNYLLPDNIYKDYLNKKNFLSLFKSPTKIISKEDYSERDIELLKNDVLASSERELVNSYLLLRSKRFIAPELHILVKSIYNIENESKSLIPKEIAQKTGMIQLGYSLNSLSKIDMTKNFIDLSKKEARNVKELARNSGKHSRFLEYVKISETKWRYDNMEKVRSFEKNKKNYNYL